MPNPLFCINDRDIFFHGRLKEDVDVAVEKLLSSLKEIEEDNEVAVRIQLPKLFNGDSKYYYGTSHRLEVSTNIIVVVSSPRIFNGGDEADDFIKSRTIFMKVLDFINIKYLVPPVWVHSCQCDCHGSGIVGSWQYRKMKIVNILDNKDSCRNDSCYVYNKFDSCGGYLPVPPELSGMVHIDTESKTWACSLHYDQVAE